MSSLRGCEDRPTEPPVRGAAAFSTERARPQRDLKREGLHRAGNSRAQSDRRVSSEASTAGKIGTTSGQVFWLPDHSTNRAFPRIQSQWRVRRSSPDTAAGPRRIQTVFPILSKQHASSTQVGRACYRPRGGLQPTPFALLRPSCSECWMSSIPCTAQSERFVSFNRVGNAPRVERRWKPFCRIRAGRCPRG